MIGHRGRAKNVWEATAIHHFDEAGFRRIKGTASETLVFPAGLVNETHDRLIAQIGHGFDEKQGARHFAQMTNGKERILKVIEESETENEVELAEGLHCGILGVKSKEANIGVAALSFGDVFLPSVNGSDVKAQ
jgi:hypothetical protein